jgi:hypothetical protein
MIDLDVGSQRPWQGSDNWLDVVVGTQPAAGASFAFAIAGQYVACLVGINYTLVTSAVVANRSVRVQYDDGSGNVFYEEASGAVVQASTTARVRHNESRHASDWDTNNNIYNPIEPLPLFGSQVVRINVQNIDAGDQLSGITMTFRRFFSGPAGSVGDSGAQ